MLSQLSSASTAAVASADDAGEEGEGGGAGDGTLPPTAAALEVALSCLGIKGSSEDVASVLQQLVLAQAQAEEQGLRGRGGGGRISFPAFASVLCLMKGEPEEDADDAAAADDDEDEPEAAEDEA